jgi:DNA mismatch repair ATPase MutS
MAGFQFFQLDRYLKTLVQDLNKYVAISEEFPTNVSGKVKSGGLLFDRRVARVITPGTLIDEKFLDPYENNFLLSIYPVYALSEPQQPQAKATGMSQLYSADFKVGLAWLDISTGDFFTQSTTKASLPSVIARVGAREIILPEVMPHQVAKELQALIGQDRHLVTLHHSEKPFAHMSEWNSMLESPVESTADSTFTQSEKMAGHQLLDYVSTRLPGLEMKLQPPRRRHLQEILSIDRNSMRGLEITETARDGLGKGSLLHAVKRTVTKGGTRLLRDRLTSPSASRREIEQRLDLLTVFYNDSELRENLTQRLRRSFDVQRLVQKFALNKGDADDMISLARAIEATSAVSSLLRSQLQQHHETEIEDSTARKVTQSSISLILDRLDLTGPVEVGVLISAAIDEEGLNQKHRLEEDEAARMVALAQKVVLTDAGRSYLDTLPKAIQLPKTKAVEIKDSDAEIEEPWIMRKTTSETILRLHNDLDRLKEEKNKLTQSLRSKLSAPTLTLKWTPGLGHICHVKSGSKALPSLDSLNARLVSSTKSTRSFYLTDWTKLGSRIDQAKLHIRSEELRIFSDLRQKVIRNLVKLRRNAAIMDELDVASSFAKLAQEQSFVRPILNNGTVSKIIGGRHPTVKLGLEEQGRSFVSNDLLLGDKERIWLVTGPNMAGKSTFLRQNALITILAQVGSYVPAEHAEIGLVDQIFSRIGAADDLFRDQSTFMVEMLETAAILRQATHRSFVIMDEVGRGTTPEDGTAVGYACLHHLYHVNKSRTLFATHFHALADMTQDFPHLARYCTDVVEDETGSFSFVHRLRKGVNRQSHALKVARLAGLPELALEVAKVVLHQLVEEKHNLHLGIQPDHDAPPTAAASG